MHPKFCAAGVAVAVGCLTGMSAQAATLTAANVVSAGCVGRSTCAPAGSGFTLTTGPVGYQLTQKVEGGVLGIGVAHNAMDLSTDDSAGEIDRNEFLGLNFAEGIIAFLDLSFLYLPGEFHDEVFEAALISTAGDTVTLTVNGFNSASASNGATVINLSPSQDGTPGPTGGGSYRIFNPFGLKTVTSVQLQPVLQTAPGTSFFPPGAQNSDFVFSQISVVGAKAIPEPGMIVTLAGLAIAGTLGLGRRKSTRA